jgi:hypothetical protein
MNNSSSTDGHVGAARWTDLLEALAGFSDTTFLESIQEDLVVSALGHLSRAGSKLHNVNAVSDTAFTPAPTTSTGAFTNFTSQINYTYPVRSHGLTIDIGLTCRSHRTSLMLGPCRAHVRPMPESPTFTRC